MDLYSPLSDVRGLNRKSIYTCDTLQRDETIKHHLGGSSYAMLSVSYIEITSFLYIPFGKLGTVRSPWSLVRKGIFSLFPMLEDYDYKLQLPGQLPTGQCMTNALLQIYFAA